ncbi:MAG: Regulatory protein AtoC [bacterium]|nr:Regulatory protein AtoC [bacterium]
MHGLIERLRSTQALAKLVGEAPAYVEAIRHLPEVANSDATVLISGETGTGKELVARAIHYLSPRVTFPFVPVHCGSLPDMLLENELFGHERGAFTDARTPSRGLLAEADKGTLFLDEIEALSAKAQVSLLRVLEEKKFRALGSTREQHVDVRVVAATNTPLADMIAAGVFRADLYYRLRVLSIHMPPLRERKEDLPLLTHHFLLKHTPPGREMPRLSAAAQAALATYDWPGNVRELENAIISAVHFCSSTEIQIDDLGVPVLSLRRHDVPTVVSTEECSFKTKKQRVIEAFEKDYLLRLMAEYHGNVSRAALAAGKERRDFGKLLKKYHIDPKGFTFSNTKLLNWILLAQILGEILGFAG